MHYMYILCVGSAELRVYGLDDRKARRLLSRWIRLVWPAYKLERATKYAGSMADAECNGWHGPPEARIYRARVDSACIVQCEPYPCIERFEVSPEPIAEFRRVWDAPRNRLTIERR